MILYILMGFEVWSSLLKSFEPNFIEFPSGFLPFRAGFGSEAQAGPCFRMSSVQKAERRVRSVKICAGGAIDRIEFRYEALQRCKK